ncbi:ATP-binding protein [Flaviaesturariibacter amylovorans]|uniref:ATP-binding protein n=1 Tax=Flaviaesturariibacter amylovorans TaxID=1084520 RepID=UPI0031E77008
MILGPESTGKSTLCRKLAQQYDTVWCPEYARTYLEQNGMNYNRQDLLLIAQGQLALEAWMAEEAKPPFFFVDTDMYVMKVWFEVVFGDCPPWILKQAAAQRADLYLLCNTDLPWVPDGLREYPDPAARERLFCMYKDILVNDGTPWALVSGTEEERLASAVSAIEERFGKEEEGE